MISHIRHQLSLPQTVGFPLCIQAAQVLAELRWERKEKLRIQRENEQRQKHEAHIREFMRKGEEFSTADGELRIIEKPKKKRRKRRRRKKSRQKENLKNE